MTYNNNDKTYVTVRQTPTFSKRLKECLNEEEYREMEWALVENPDQGVVIPGLGGIRKFRWSAEGRGKSGGVRIIYYWFVSEELIYMMLIYPKNVQDNLTPDQKKFLKKLLDAEIQEMKKR